MHDLPALPSNVRTLLNDESSRLNRLYPDLPRSPDDCGTCGGRKRFLWWNRYSPDYRPDAPVIVEYDCPCEDQWILQRWLTLRGVNAVYQRLGWEDAQAVAPSTLDVVTDYLAHSERYVSVGMGFVLTGAKGTGKTMLANLMLKTLMLKGFDGYFSTFAEALQTFRSGWNDAEDKAWYANKVRGSRVMALDDVGREHFQQRYEEGKLTRNAQSAAESTLDELRRHRVSSAKPTFLTTNFEMAQISQYYGDNVFSLITERSVLCEFKAADWRTSARERTQQEVRDGLSRPVVLL